MTLRRVVGAVVVAIVYVGLAAFSAWLSPLARRPVLDGLAPVAPYRWVSPPPDLASGNQEPAAGSFDVPLTARGSEPGVFITTDNQVTIVVDRDTFAPNGDDRTVRLTVTPLDPATLGPMPSELTAFGNAIELRATYEPSGNVLRRVELPIRFIAVYPTTQTLHATTHQLLRSAGEMWTPLRSQDAPGIQQVEAPVERPGYLVVAGVLTPNPVTTSPAGEGPDPLVVILLVGSGAAMLIGATLLFRGRTVK